MAQTSKKWCGACCKIVDTVIRETAPVAMKSVLGGLGAVHAATRPKPSLLDAVVKTGFGVVAGHALDLLVLKGQEMVCGECGCSHVTELAS